ncbi:autophagy-related protein 22 family protein [Skeletonema marinoi]|uniref:Autophagy-related protein 22 family protein n=1 Tax=Skeletonema marinoi TaxID=267567 RepID=A0AAD8YIN9_9STRA|nr:autophagy-related protein 22 family protein [Skeletonema marinoi]
MVLQYNALESFTENDTTTEVRAPTADSSNQKQPSNLIPSIFRFDNDNSPIEATGLALNSIARGLVGMSSLFLGPALLILAQDAANEASGCNTTNNNDDGQNDCSDDDDEGRVYGMRPSSLLTNIGVFSGVFSAILLPLFGAIVDHTPHRKAIGQWAAILLSIIKGLKSSHLCAAYAYTAELSIDPKEQTIYNARFQTINYFSMLAFLIVVTLTSSLLHVGDMVKHEYRKHWHSSYAPSYLALLGSGSSPALRQVPDNSTLLTAGFRKLSHTSSEIIQHWAPLRYFLLSVMLSESATGALSTISTTYMIHVLNMTSSQIGYVFLCVFVAGIPGSKLVWTGILWVPPFLFTFLNEIGASMRIGLGSLNLFFAGGFVFLKMIGDYQDAVDFALSRGVGGDGDDTWSSKDSCDGSNGAKRLSLPELT